MSSVLSNKTLVHARKNTSFKKPTEAHGVDNQRGVGLVLGINIVIVAKSA